MKRLVDKADKSQMRRRESWCHMLAISREQRKKESKYATPKNNFL